MFVNISNLNKKEVKSQDKKLTCKIDILHKWRLIRCMCVIFSLSMHQNTRKNGTQGVNSYVKLTNFTKHIMMIRIF